MTPPQLLRHLPLFYLGLPLRVTLPSPFLSCPPASPPVGHRDCACKTRQPRRCIAFGRFEMELPKGLNLGRGGVSTTAKVVIVVGITIAGVLTVGEAARRHRRRLRHLDVKDFGAFVERFEICPSPQPPPPAACHRLSDLMFTVSDNFEIEGFVAAGYGNPDWKRTNEPSSQTTVVVSWLLKNEASCVGRIVLDEFSFGVIGENLHFGTPYNPTLPSLVPGGSCSGSAVAVAAELVDFAGVLTL